MKYLKKIKKHCQFISNKDYLLDCASNLSTLKCASALLEGLCCHLFTGENPLPRIHEVKKVIFSLLKDTPAICSPDEINFYSNVLSALLAYFKSTKENDALCYIEKLATPLFACLLSELKITSSKEFSTDTPAKSLCAINCLAEYAEIASSSKIKTTFDEIVDEFLKIDLTSSKDNCFDYLTTCLGVLKYAKLTGKQAVNESIAQLFDNFTLNAQSLNYASAISFASKGETSAAATARSMEVALCLFDNLNDERYLTMARRIWFNGMQFCQRENGQVGAEFFTTESSPNLKLSRYEIKQITTPLYAIGLKCFAQNKQIFEESGTLFKDRRGRYFIGDKMFCLDESGFFGRDLIEIPTLTAFDRETALQLNLKIVF